jgi:hypothetical protein
MISVQTYLPLDDSVVGREDTEDDAGEAAIAEDVLCRRLDVQLVALVGDGSCHVESAALEPQVLDCIVPSAAGA